MKKTLFLAPILLFGSFISNQEYGLMLYNNPRGISCAKCHGSKGKGELIATYIDDKTGKKQQLIAPNISNLTWKVFFNKIKYSKILKNGKFKVLNYSVMPKYDYLTDSEIKAIYDYITSKKEKK